jgi:hypothetical protein
MVCEGSMVDMVRGVWWIWYGDMKQTKTAICQGHKHERIMYDKTWYPPAVVHVNACVSSFDETSSFQSVNLAAVECVADARIGVLGAVSLATEDLPGHPAHFGAQNTNS